MGMTQPMPTKGTTRRSIRCEDALWAAAQTKAAKEGRNVSDIIRQLLKQWINEGEK